MAKQKDMKIIKVKTKITRLTTPHFWYQSTHPHIYYSLPVMTALFNSNGVVKF